MFKQPGNFFIYINISTSMNNYLIINYKKKNAMKYFFKLNY